MITDASQDTVLRMALGIFAIAPGTPCTPVLQRWIVARLEDTAALTAHERAQVRQPLLDWYKQHYTRSYDIVAAQFEEESPYGTL